MRGKGSWALALVVAAALVAVGVEARARTVFLGGSQTAGWRYMNFFPDVDNRGVVSNTTAKILKSLGPIIELKPEKVFILEGVNEIKSDQAAILKRYREILARLAKGSPKTLLFVQSVLPVSNRPDLGAERIASFNQGLRALCGEFANCLYVDLHTSFLAEGSLDRLLTSDGVHLRPEGYRLWQRLIETYVTTPADRIVGPDTLARLQPDPAPPSN